MQMDVVTPQFGTPQRDERLLEQKIKNFGF